MFGASSELASVMEFGFKPPIPNVVENFAEDWFSPVKIKEGPPKTKMCISENSLCNIYPLGIISPISIGGLLRVKKTKQKVPIGPL